MDDYISELLQNAADENLDTPTIPIFLVYEEHDSCYISATLKPDVTKNVCKKFYYSAAMVVEDKMKLGVNVQKNIDLWKKLPANDNVPSEEQIAVITRGSYEDRIEELESTVNDIVEFLDDVSSAYFIAFCKVEKPQFGASDKLLFKIVVHGKGHSEKFPTISMGRTFMGAQNFKEAIDELTDEVDEDEVTSKFLNKIK